MPKSTKTTRCGKKITVGVGWRIGDGPYFQSVPIPRAARASVRTMLGEGSVDPYLGAGRVESQRCSGEAGRVIRRSVLESVSGQAARGHRTRRLD